MILDAHEVEAQGVGGPHEGEDRADSVRARDDRDPEAERHGRRATLITPSARSAIIR
jgi:hypothetical protein